MPGREEGSEFRVRGDQHPLLSLSPLEDLIVGGGLQAVVPNDAARCPASFSRRASTGDSA